MNRDLAAIHGRRFLGLDDPGIHTVIQYLRSGIHLSRAAYVHEAEKILGDAGVSENFEAEADRLASLMIEQRAHVVMCTPKILLLDRTSETPTTDEGWMDTIQYTPLGHALALTMGEGVVTASRLQHPRLHAFLAAMRSKQGTLVHGILVDQLFDIDGSVRRNINGRGVIAFKPDVGRGLVLVSANEMFWRGPRNERELADCIDTGKEGYGGNAHTNAWAW